MKIRWTAFAALFLIAVAVAGLNAWRTGFHGAPTKSGGTLLPAGIRAASFADVTNALRLSNAIFLDARPQIFHDRSHLEGSLCLPPEEASVRLSRLGLGEDKSYVIYCDGGNCLASVKLARILSGFGFKNLAVYEGGMDELSNRLPSALRGNGASK